MNSATKHVIVYLAHGTESVYHQTVFSILTLYHHTKGDFKDFTVVLYTDNKAFFSPYLGDTGVVIEDLTKEQLVEFMGERRFIHRVKTFVIKDCFSKYQKDLLYLDGDTMFMANPAGLLKAIAPACSVMNCDEYDMHDGGIHELQHWFDLRTALKANAFVLHGKQFKIPLATRMWNAGILGISQANAYLLEDVISLTDQLYAKCPLFNVEQFATSYVLQNHATVVSSGNYILHYCYGGVKSRYTYHLGLFFERNKNQPVAVLSRLAFEFSQSLDALTAPPTAAKKMTVLDRAVLRLQLVKEVAITGGLRSKW
ncbi:hypothetical protein [Hymenobacter caeli]|nr:hypothetical protein [Hymenobacter caeli]